MKWYRFNNIIKHIEIIVGLWLFSRLIWVLFLVGIQLKDVQEVLDITLVVLKAMAKKLRVKF